MGGIQSARYWKGQLDVYGNPMPKCQPGFGQVIPQNDVPSRKTIDKNSPSRFEYSNAVIQPLSAPRNVVVIRTIIVHFCPVFFRQVKRGISKYRINSLGADKGQKLQAVPPIKSTQPCRTYLTIFNARFNNIRWCPYSCFIEDWNAHDVCILDRINIPRVAKTFCIKQL